MPSAPEVFLFADPAPPVYFVPSVTYPTALVKTATVKPALDAITVRLRGIADALASVLLPAPCRVCAEPLDTAGRIPICSACLASLAPYAGPQCAKCGQPLVSRVAVDTAAQALCPVCRRALYHFDFARSYGVYTPAMAGAIILLKHHRVLPLGAWFAAKLLAVAAQELALREVDVVVPVPQHRLRQKERGHNHAELLAKPLARRLNLPCRPSLLLRTRPRPEKLRLTLRERWRTVRGAYAVPEGARVDKLRVLLVDDVFTTGATLDACSQTLRAAGASYIAALTVARAVSRGQPPTASPLQEPYE